MRATRTGFLCVAAGAALAAAAALTAQTARPPAKAAPKSAKKTAKPAPAEAEYPLAALRVSGNKFFSAAQVIAASGLKTGGPVSKPVFDQARDRLIASGAFLSVGLSYAPAEGAAAYNGVIEVVETADVYPVRFEELPVAEARIRQHLNAYDPLAGPKIPGTKEFVDRWTREVDAFVRQQMPGWGDRVVGKLTPDLEVLFRPATPRASVAETRFTGNSALPASLLQNTLNTVAIGTAYTEPSIRQLLETSIRPLYDARGRLRVSFPKVSAEKSKNSDGVAVGVTVDEGPVFQIGEVHITGAGKRLKDLQKLADWKTGDVADFDRIKAGQQAMHDEMKRDGYLKVKSLIERAVDDKKRSVDIVLALDAGAQYVFGKLEIQGLDLLTEPAIRKAWSLEAGKPFNAEYADRFLKRLQDDGVFENLASSTATTRIDEASRTVDVTLTFKGGSTDPEKVRRRRPGA